MIKKLLIIALCLALCLSFTACSTGFDSLEYTEVTESDKPRNAKVAENSKYIFEIDKVNMGLVLTDKATGLKFSTTPISSEGEQLDEFGLPVSKHPRVESILMVECKNFEKGETNTYYSFNDVVKNGEVTHKMIDNGIVINYHFTDAQVMIPLTCELTEKGLKLSVNPKEIEEGENKVLTLSIAPFFCGVENDADNSYLFVPSGSGAIVDVSNKSQQGDSYSAQVYGYDPAIDEVAVVSTKESVRLNVFGAKSGDKAMCAIIDGSPASAKINVTSGATAYGYSSVYASFILRGYTNHIAELFSYEKVHNVVYAKKMISKPVSVTYCPLLGEDANYSGMAKTYREYLTDTYNLGTDAKEVPLSVRILGGTEMKQSFLGIPYETVYTATTLSDAEKIIAEIKDKLGATFAVQLKGFGDSGVDVGKIAGNYKVNKNLGTAAELKKLGESLKEQGIDLYFDFDIESFNTNSSGVSKFYDSATNAGELKALQYNYDMAVRDKQQDTAYNLLSPAAFGKVIDKVLSKTKNFGLFGLSLDSLSSTAYSDYIDKESSEYYSKNGFDTAAQKVINKTKEKGKKFMASSANVYSAVLADLITEAPVTSEKSNVFLYDVPFYQMVFKGSVPLTIQSVNLAADSKLMLLKAVESGSGLGYTVINNWDSAVIDAKTPYFYNSVFTDIKEGMFNYSETLADYYGKISGSKIASHTVLESGLRQTVFENGVVAYVNYTGNALNSPAGEIAPYDYLITEK